MRCSLGGMEKIKVERNEFQSDGTENHDQNGVDLGVFEVQIIRFLIKIVLWLNAKVCLLFERGAHFRKNHKNKWSKSEK